MIDYDYYLLNVALPHDRPGCEDCPFLTEDRIHRPMCLPSGEFIHDRNVRGWRCPLVPVTQKEFFDMKARSEDNV